MLSQEYLNGIDLRTASEEISKALISERETLQDTLKQLEQDKAKFQEQYNIAADGDSSENAPLEAAIKNLKANTGDILFATQKKQNLDIIEDATYLAHVYDYDTILQHIQNLSEESRGVLFGCFDMNIEDDFKKMIIDATYQKIVDGLLKFSEYWSASMTNIIKAEYDESDPIWKSVVALQEVASDKTSDGILFNERAVITDLEDVKKMKSVFPYNTCGVIVPYTTVRVELDGKRYTYKIYPEGISFIDNGVIAANSALAAALLGRNVGDVVSVKHASKGTTLRYKVVDIY